MALVKVHLAPASKDGPGLVVIKNCVILAAAATEVVLTELASVHLVITVNTVP